METHPSKVVNAPGWFSRISSFAWIDVGIFFFISGYGLAFGYHNKAQYFNEFHKRLLSVLIPFLVAHLVYLVGDTLFGISFGFADVWKSLLGQSTLVRNDWYVPACLLFYFVFWAIYRSNMDERRKPIMLWIAVSVYVIVFSFVLKLGSFWWMNAISFVGGVWWQTICKREATCSDRNKCIVVWMRRIGICIVGYLLGYIGVPISNRIFGTYAYEVCYNAMSLFGVGMIVLLFSTIGSGNRVTSFIAAISYEIYLYHGLFIDGFRSKVMYIHNDTLYVVAVYAATIILSMIMHFAVAWLKKKTGKRQNANA